MSTHRVIYPDLSAAAPGASIEVSGEEAHHAVRVKRVRDGDRLDLRDGRGVVASARVASSRKRGGDWVLELVIDTLERREPENPSLHVLAAAPKGDRLAEMIDGLSQAGAASWRPLLSERTVVEPRDGKLERLTRIAAESMKQSGRAWAMQIAPALSFGEAIRQPGLVVADADGDPYEPSGAPGVTLLVGPEGGWTPAELDALRSAGSKIVRFGRHIMRTETAAIVAAAIIMERERFVSGARAR